MTAIPRRLSVHDADFDQHMGAGLIVYLDGERQKHAEAYDIDAGTVTRCKLDERGFIYADGEEVARETVRGVVTVERVAS